MSYDTSFDRSAVTAWAVGGRGLPLTALPLRSQGERSTGTLEEKIRFEAPAGVCPDEHDVFTEDITVELEASLLDALEDR